MSAQSRWSGLRSTEKKSGRGERSGGKGKSGAGDSNSSGEKGGAIGGTPLLIKGYHTSARGKDILS